MSATVAYSLVRQLEKDGKTEEYDTEGTGDRSQAS